jgi:AcrR family transcriptional regulator
MSRQRAVTEFVESQQTKKELEVLNVASEYFLSHGYKGTSINAMARDSGISKESIYRYFSSKLELFEAVVAKELAEYKEKLQFTDFEYESMSLKDALKRTAETIVKAVSSDRTLSLRRLIFQETIQSPDIGQYYYEIGPEVAYRHLEKVFAAHKDETNFDPVKLAPYFVGMVLHNAMLQRECGVKSPLTKKQIANHAAEVTDNFVEAFFRK